MTLKEATTQQGDLGLFIYIPMKAEALQHLTGWSHLFKKMKRKSGIQKMSCK
jgi:hypothetical protein